MAEIVSGLFGVNPQQLMRQRQATDADNAFRFAQLDPMGRAQMAIYQGGAGLGRAVSGLLGGDAEMQKASKIQELSSQFDLSTPQGAREFGRALQPFAPVEAMKALTKADAMEQSMLTRQKTQADIGVTQRKELQEEKLRTELAALPPGAGNEAVLAVVSKYGNPDVILRTLQASEDKKAALEQRRATADLAAATREETRAQKQFLLDEKRLEKAKSEEQRIRTITDSADRIINTVEKAIPLVGKTTAGVAGAVNIPGTEGRNLDTAITTIKANLGFDRLQQMRDASPTGGALGQVAVQELEALQSTVASLDRGQTPDVLQNNLKDVKYYYDRWRKAVNGQDPGPAVRPSDKTQQTPIYATNPTTNQRIVSTDGGTTWKPVGGQ
jgi:hypothetical protein